MEEKEIIDIIREYLEKEIGDLTCVIIPRNDTSSNWALNDPTLADGEYGVETDTHRVKRGDGQSEWTELPYETFGIENLVETEAQSIIYDNSVSGVDETDVQSIIDRILDMLGDAIRDIATKEDAIHKAQVIDKESEVAYPSVKAVMDYVKAAAGVAQENLDKAKAELQSGIDTVQSNLETVAVELDTKIDTTKAELQKAIDDNTGADKEALARLEQSDVEIRKDIAENVAAIEATNKTLEEKETELNSKIAENTADIDTNRTNIAASKELIDANKEEIDQKLENTRLALELEIGTNKAELENTLAESENELNMRIGKVETDLTKKVEETTATAQTNLDTAKTELNTKIDANKAELDNKIDTAKTELETAINENKAADEVTKTELNNKIDTVNTELNNKVAANKVLIDTNKETIEANKADIETKLETTKTELNTKIDSVNTTLDTKINDTKTGLEERIEKAIEDISGGTETSVAELDAKIADNKVLIDNNTAAIEENKAEIEANTLAIENNKTELNTKIDDSVSTLNTKIDTTKSTLETSIADTKTELNSKIDTTKADLTTKVNEVQTNLDTAKAELEEAKIDKTFTDNLVNKVKSKGLVGSEILSLEVTNVNPVDNTTSTEAIKLVSSDGTVVATKNEDGSIDLKSTLDVDVNYFITSEILSTEIPSESVISLDTLTATDKEVVELQDIITDPEGTWARVESIDNEAGTLTCVTFHKHAQAVWGTIKGNIKDQSDLQVALKDKPSFGETKGEKFLTIRPDGTVIKGIVGLEDGNMYDSCVSVVNHYVGYDTTGESRINVMADDASLEIIPTNEGQHSDSIHVRVDSEMVKFEPLESGLESKKLATAIRELKGLDDLKVTIENFETFKTENSTAIDTAKAELNTAIEANKAAIEENKLNIATNVANIEINKQAIASNLADIEALEVAVAKNVSDILDNKTNIEANDADIVTINTTLEEHKAGILSNTGLINANKEAIETNKTAIAENKTAIEANKTSIEANKALIDTNIENIATNKANIEANKALLDEHSAELVEHENAIIVANSNIGLNEQAIKDNKALIEANTTAINENKEAISKNNEAIVANANEIASVKVATETNASNIETNKAAIEVINTDLITVGNAITTNSENIAKNKADIETINNSILGINENIDTIEANVTANAEAIEANANEIAVNKTAISENALEIAANKEAIETNKTDIATNKANIEVNKTAIADNKALIDANKEAIETNKTNIEANKLAIEANKTAIESNDTDITNLQETKAEKSFAEAIDNKVVGKVELDKISNNTIAKLNVTSVSPVDGSTSAKSFELKSTDNTLVAQAITDDAGNVTGYDLATNLDVDVNYFITSATLNTTIPSDNELGIYTLTATDKTEVEINDIITDAEGTWARVKSIDKVQDTLVCVTFHKHAQATWGTIKGTLADQKDLKEELDKKFGQEDFYFVSKLGLENASIVEIKPRIYSEQKHFNYNTDTQTTYKQSVTFDSLDGSIVYDYKLSAETSEEVNGTSGTILAKVEAEKLAFDPADSGLTSVLVNQAIRELKRLDDAKVTIADFDKFKTDNTARIDGVEAKVTENTTEIAGLGVIVEENKTGLATLKTQVDINTVDIDLLKKNTDTSKVELQEELEALTTEVETVKTNVTTNTTDIATNKDAIEELKTTTQTELDGKVDKVDTPSILYGNNEAGELAAYNVKDFTDMIDAKVSKVEDAEILYGTDAEGKQVTYFKSEIEGVKTVASKSPDENGNVSIEAIDVTFDKAAYTPEFMESADNLQYLLNNVLAQLDRVTGVLAYTQQVWSLDNLFADPDIMQYMTAIKLGDFFSATSINGVVLMAKITDLDKVSDMNPMDYATPYIYIKSLVEAGAAHLVGISEQVKEAEPKAIIKFSGEEIINRYLVEKENMPRMTVTLNDGTTKEIMLVAGQLDYEVPLTLDQHVTNILVEGYMETTGRYGNFGDYAYEAPVVDTENLTETFTIVYTEPQV